MITLASQYRKRWILKSVEGPNSHRFYAQSVKNTRHPKMTDYARGAGRQ
jgi:hypothetical protein